MLSNNMPRRRERSVKKQYCRICRRRTDHVFDHGENMFICANHEL